MKIPHRLRTVKFRTSSSQVTSFAGLLLLFDLAIELGLVRDLQSLTVKKRRRGTPIEDFVLSLAANFVVEGDSLSDLDTLHQGEVTRGHSHDLEVPAPTTAGERLASFRLRHIRQMQTVNSTLVVSIDDRMGGDDSSTIDLDSSIIKSHGYFPEGARYGYKRGVKGLHALLAFWYEPRLLLGCRLRAGNRRSHDAVESFIEEIVGAIPARRGIRFRMDTGFYSKKVEGVCLKHAAGFSISAAQTERLRMQIEALLEGAWTPHPWEEGAEWAEFSYQPRGRSAPYRLLDKRTPWFEKEQWTLGKYITTAVITNLRRAGASLIRYHLARGGMEKYIEEFKNGIGARHLPSRRFLANWTWLLIAALAYNLAQAFKLLLLPSSEHHIQMKSLRLHWFTVAARWIRTGRRWVVTLARGLGHCPSLYAHPIPSSQHLKTATEQTPSMGERGKSVPDGLLGAFRSFQLFRNHSPRVHPCPPRGSGPRWSPSMPLGYPSVTPMQSPMALERSRLGRLLEDLLTSQYAGIPYGSFCETGDMC